MVTYKCKRCGFTTHNQTNFRRHFAQKRRCPPQSPAHDVHIDVEAEVAAARPPKPFVCRCGKALASRSSLSQHRVNACALTRRASSDTPPSANETPTANTGTTTIINVNVMNITTNITNNTNSFGSETFEHVLQDTGFMLQCVVDPSAKLAAFVVKGYFREPRNQNVCIPNRSRAVVAVRSGARWILRPSTELDKVIRTYSTLLQRFVDVEGCSRFDEVQVENLKQWVT